MYIVYLLYGYIFSSNFCLERDLNHVWKERGFLNHINTSLSISTLNSNLGSEYFMVKELQVILLLIKRKCHNHTLQTNPRHRFTYHICGVWKETSVPEDLASRGSQTVILRTDSSILSSHLLKIRIVWC